MLNIFLIFFFVIGLLAIIQNSNNTSLEQNPNEIESFHNPDECPDMLIKEGNVLLLLNTSKPRENGVNPKIFKNLDEYINYLEVERTKGKKCPILFLYLPA